ncbi:MAG: hypothetical protein WD038_03610 [Balneolales bacterium]
MTKFPKLLTLALLFALALLNACKGPSTPDFSTEHALDIPLISNQKITVMGGSLSLIDTTGQEGFDTLFTSDPEGLVSIASDMDFNFGDFSDAVPEININNANIDTEIGILEVPFSGSGELSFEEVTGQPAAIFPAGTLVPPNNATVDMELDAGAFESAEVEDGGIRITFTNNLGFDIEEIEASLLADGSGVGSTLVLQEVETGSTETGVIDFNKGDLIETELKVEVQLNWDSQTSSADAGDLKVEASDEGLAVSKATAVLNDHSFSTGGEIEVDDEFFVFENDGHFIHLNSGDLKIVDFVNEIDLDLDLLKISFPGIRTGAYGPQDSLVVLLDGNDRIRRSSTTPEAVSVSLEDMRIYATDNILEYNIEASTENTRDHPQGDSVRTVSSTDRITANVEIQDLGIGFVRGMVQPRTIPLSNDDPSNGEGILDLFTESEVQKTEMNGLDMLSGSDVSLYGPSLNLFYDTNLGIGTTVYGAILGVNEDGDEVYLSGSNGSSLQVTPGDNITGLQSNGLNIPPEDLVKLKIEKAPTNGGTISGAIVFDQENSTIEEFFNNVPEDIYFIGKAVVNKNSEEGEISTPIKFNTSMGIDIPINLATHTPAAYEDTLSVDLSDLPSENDDTMLSSSSLRIEYDNGMPFDVDLFLEFLDANFNMIAQVPVAGNHDDQQITINSAQVNEETRFTSSANDGMIEISLTNEQMQQLHQTRHLSFTGTFGTSSNEQVKLKTDDYIDLSIFGKFKIESRVGD